MNATYDTIRAIADQDTTVAVMTALEQQDGSMSSEESAAFGHLVSLDDNDWLPIREVLRESADGRAVIEAVEERR